MKICVVSNRPPARNLSGEIDGADLVVRVSKCDHLDTGLCGQRTDVVVLEPNELWATFTAEKRRMELLRRCRVLIRPWWFDYWKYEPHRRRFDLAAELPHAEPLPAALAIEHRNLTTQANAAAWAQTAHPEAGLVLAGFDPGVAYAAYLQGTRYPPMAEQAFISGIRAAFL
jgi:hypothetical protein